MKKLVALSLVVAGALAFQSCNKSTKFEKGTISFKVNGKTVVCNSAVAGQITIGNTVTISGHQQSGVMTKQIVIVCPNAVLGTNHTQPSGDHLVIAYTSSVDLYATHWDDELVGDAEIDFEIISPDEIKATFSGTLKKQDGSETITITDGKAWTGN
jgi:hypothetical protein